MNKSQKIDIKKINQKIQKKLILFEKNQQLKHEIKFENL